MDKRPVIVFAKSSSERDYLRSLFPGGNSGVISFEKESSCFDNLCSIDPRAVIVRTDDPAVAWRFLFAMHTMGAGAQMMILSNDLVESLFDLHGLNMQVSCLPIQYGGNGFASAFDRSLSSDNKSCTPVGLKLLVGKTETIQRINAALPSLKEANEPILIVGEAGTGKELLARLIAGCASEGSVLIKLDCASLQSQKTLSFSMVSSPPNFNLLEKLDRISIPADGTTILLDKIDRLDKEAQGEILLLLEKQSGRAADDSDIKVRFIATSETDLQHLVKCNSFRKELFYRLNVIPVYLPPLRARTDDIPLLSDYISVAACARMQRSFTFPRTKTVERFCTYNWPGNIDELEQVVGQLIASGEESDLRDLTLTSEPKQKPAKVFYQSVEAETVPNILEIKRCLPVLGDLSLKHICETFASKTEKKLMQKALETTNWNRKKAAALLNISYKSMLNKMKLYEIV